VPTVGIALLEQRSRLRFLQRRPVGPPPVRLDAMPLWPGVASSIRMLLLLACLLWIGLCCWLALEG
jgi:hypothetical protein